LDDLPTPADVFPRVRQRAVEFCLPDATAFLHDLTGWAVARGEKLEHLTVQRPSLEDVYLALTGDFDGELERLNGLVTAEEAARLHPASGGLGGGDQCDGGDPADGHP
jgi:ABC-2 type transport system ATP-binding protein